MKQGKTVEHLLATVAARQDEAPVEPIVEQTRRRLVARKERKGWRWGLSAAGALAIAALVVLWITFFGDRPLQFEVAGRPAVAEDWLSASPQESVPIRFSNGASVLLSPGSRGRITELRSTGATVDLVHGTASVAIPPMQQQQWLFLAGPFRVKVVGTRFDLTWDNARQQMDLKLLDGSVEVEAPWLSPQRVVAGQSLRLIVPHEADDAAATDCPADVPNANDISPVEKATSTTKPAPIRSQQAPAPSWQTLAVAGDFREAFARAQAAGFDQLVAQSNASDLLLLGDTSRYAGHGAKARQCYQALRQRFSSTSEGSRALFRLGVLDFPSPNSVVFFETFLRERPADPLAPEALGRILEVHHRSGNTSQAKVVAQRYLASYPTGAHAKLAQGVLGE